MCQLTLVTPGPEPALLAASRSQQLAVIPATSRDTFSPDIQVALGQGAGAQAQVGRGGSQEIAVSSSAPKSSIRSKSEGS